MLCFAHEDSVAWGAQWGSEILRRVPSIRNLALYNLSSPCACERCRDGGSTAHVAAFLRRCRAEWKKVRSKVRIGHVGVSDEHSEALDFLMPFVIVNRSTADAPPLDAAALLEGAVALRSRHKTRAVLPFAKTCWENATKNTTGDVAATIAEAERRGTGLVLWYHEWLFHDRDGRYDEKALVDALGGDWAKLKEYCAKPSEGAGPAPAGSPNWFYFESKESTAGGPKLVLTLKGASREIRAAGDTTLITYLPNNVMGSGGWLAVSLNDTNRVLIAFDSPKRVRRSSLRKAELVLDMKNSKPAPVSVPFELALHAVTSDWSETAASWSRRPTFESAPAATLKVEPRAQILRIDLTDLVKRWLKRDVANHGVLIKVAAPMEDTGQAAPASAPETPPELTFPTKEKRIEKLPWPHQAAGLKRAEVEKQADEKGQWRYFHGGLDIVLENGTEIYAMKDGFVKAIMGSSIVIAEKKGDKPCYGWSYSHLGSHTVKVGDFVKRGTVIGEVDFKGLAHIHLERVFSQGPHWGAWHYICVPNGHFTYTDDDPPVIETPFHFFPNGSDDRIESDDAGEVRLSGSVDIVVGMREAGRYAHSDGGFGDRLGVMRTDYEIARVGGGTKRSFRSFDFGILNFRKGYSGRAYGTELTKVVYKHYALLETGKRGGNKVLCYYVITNCAGDEPPRKLDPEDRKHAWDTAGKDAKGRPLFPDGTYRITVTATDFDHNEASASMTVTVANGG
jgi:murein DD-endopeptidase MepM/ murein hydrolase activator NlpD